MLSTTPDGMDTAFIYPDCNHSIVIVHAVAGHIGERHVLPGPVDYTHVCEILAGMLQI